MIRKVKSPGPDPLPYYKVTVMVLPDKTVEGKARMQFGDGPVAIKRIRSTTFNTWEMFSVLTSWLHAQSTKIKQEERIRGLKLVDFPKGEGE